MTYTAPELIQIIAALTTLVGVVGGIFISLRNGARTATAINEIRQNTETTEQIRVATNGLTHQLTAATHSAGIAEGRDQMAAETIETEATLERGRVEGRAEPKPL